LYYVQDIAIGTGTGKYNNKQLFRTRQNHASLIPCMGLMKADEFYGSAARVPPPPSFVGQCVLLLLLSFTSVNYLCEFVGIDAPCYNKVKLRLISMYLR
jgi:hypothetical protein